MAKYTGLQFEVFDLLRFPLILGVVFIHCFGGAFDFEAIDFAHLTGVDFYNLIRVSISRVLTHVSVPIFFVISGYLFFIGLEKWNVKEYLKKLKKRVKSLLVPFLIWNSVCILLAAFSTYRHEGWMGVQHFLSDNGYWHLYWDCRAWNIDRTNLLGGQIYRQDPIVFHCGFCVI